MDSAKPKKSSPNSNPKVCMDLKASRFNRVIIGVHNQTEEELMLSATFPFRKNWFEEAKGSLLRDKLNSQFGPEEFPRWATVRRAQLERIAGNLACELEELMIFLIKVLCDA
jgi:hypothetical protein